MARIFLYTDEPVLARGLSHVLSTVPGLEMAAVCSSTATLMEGLLAAKADVLLLDLTPEVGFGTLLDVQRWAPGCRIVLWVRAISTEIAYQAIEHGVRGILRRTLPPEILVKCLQVVADGGLWFEEALKASFSSARTVSLTRRESQLVGLLSQGLKNKEIATALFISEGTVKVYLSRLFHKLGVKDRFELALYGLKNMASGESSQSTEGAHTAIPPRKGAVQAQWLRSLVMGRSLEKAGNQGTFFDS